MTQTLDEFIPEHILVVPCPWCGKIFSEYEAFMYCNDSYDQFPEVDDPASGCIESEWSVRCPWCQKAVDFLIEEYPVSFEIVKTKAPPSAGLFAAPMKGLFSAPEKGLFSVPEKTEAGLFALPPQGGLFSVQSNLPAVPKKGLFSLNRRKR